MKFARLLTAAIIPISVLPAWAGIVQGVILDNASGRPLARAVVRVQMVPAANATGSDRSASEQVRTVRAGVGGQFSFGLPSGLYLLTATRDAYFPAAYGSRRPLGRATPIEVTKDSVTFAELRMRHQGGLTGHVYDENGVPMPGIPVIAYRARLPLRSAGTAVSDDRGIYRIGGLEPGRYWVRSAAQRLNDTSSWLPMFGPGSRDTSQAKMQTVTVENDTAFADINPEPGRLFSVSGLVGCDALIVVKITLSSEAGQKTTQVPCGGTYQFDGLAPAAYEISGVSPDGQIAGFIELYLDRDNANASIQLTRAPVVDVELALAGSNARITAGVKLFGRRQNLSETENEVEIRPRMQVVPGYWEFRAEVPPGMYVESINVTTMQRARAAKVERPSNAFDGSIPVRAQSTIRVVLSDKPGRISGRVLNRGEVVAGVPVFLMPLTASASRALGGARETLADSGGRYRFENLPQGEYQLVASFDVNDIAEELGEVRTAERVTAASSQPVTADLTLWVAP